MEKDFKYKKHSEAQVQRILDTAERLFIREGIGQVTISKIARECNMSRATVYKYFHSVEQILWEIHHVHMRTYGLELKKILHIPGQTTYDQIATYFTFLLDHFESDPSYYLFLDVFEKVYQQDTTIGDYEMYKRVFRDDDFGSGDTVQILAKDFHDGSVHPALDPISTCVSLVYSALSILNAMAKNSRYLPIKYATDALVLAKMSLKMLLEGIAP
ncbi:MAG: TetR/AcrR family transcriptional regulator [Tissierellia bacterium]|nr:TetR/AcrR family transcriptional regulator [Tissierellia bacterium]